MKKRQRGTNSFAQKAGYVFGMIFILAVALCALALIISGTLWLIAQILPVCR